MNGAEKALEAPHPARFSYVAGRYCRTHRKIVSQERTASEVRLTLECGHVTSHVTHFQYDGSVPCLKCGIAAASELPEFKGFYDAEGNPIKETA